MTTKTCPRKGCGYKQTIMKEKRKQNKTYRCGGCNKINKLSALFIAVIFALGSLGTVYAATQTFIFDEEFLVDTATWNQTQTLPDNSTDIDIFVKWKFNFPANATVNPEPVKGDPTGIFYELLIGDKASIFSSVVDRIIEAIDDIEKMIEEIIGPETVYTHEQQVLINDVHKFCDKLSERLTVIGLAFDFEYKTDEYYATHEIIAKKDAADCRARAYLGDNVLGSMYDTLAEEAKADAIAFGQITTTDQSKRSDADYSIGGDMWNKQAEYWLNYAQTTLVKDYGYGQTYDKHYQGDPVISTDDNSPTAEEKAQTKLEQQKLSDDNSWKAACRGYWNSAGEGSVSIRGWDTHLLNGDCQGYILDRVDEDGTIHYIDVEQAKLDRIQFEFDEADRLQQGRITNAEEIKAENIRKAQEEYDRLTTIAKTNSTNGTGN